MELTNTVAALNVLGDESRIRLCALLRDRELRVTDLVQITGLSQSRVSTHLARLREAGFVRDRRDGPHAFYALPFETLPTTAKVVLDEAKRSNDSTLHADRKRLADLEARRGQLPDGFAGSMDLRYSPGRTWQSLSAGLAALLQLGDVLDVGSGDGGAAAQLARYCRSLTCLDRSSEMITAARARFAKQAHVHCIEADAEALPFDAARFDAVLAFHTLTYAERPERVLTECARVLRPGGRLVVLSLAAHEHSEITAPFGERHAGFSPKKLRAMLGKAGLAVSHLDIACHEPKKPHFEVVLALATHPPSTP